MSHSPARTDILPVIIGGDGTTYPLAREFFEAYGVTTTCVVPDPIAVIKHSRFVETHHTESLDAGAIRGALLQLAEKSPDRTVIVMANTDAMIERLEQVVALGVPGNVIVPIAPHDVAARVSDKVEFARLCERYGMDTPKTEVVSLAGEEPPAPSGIGFPVVAKPAVSSEYMPLLSRGLKKVYFVQTQDELDATWADIRAKGFHGDFLVQELIGGDDTYMDSITAYVGRDGKVKLFASAQVLLEDHTPWLLGNPVSMITRPMPELWEKLGHMLEDIGWRGFANLDLKRDPKDGRVIFMDFNPRIGANSYYVCAAGVNPMQVLVEDVVDGACEPRRAERTVLYTRTPASLTRRYLTDPELLREFDRIVASGEVYNPMRCPAESLASRQAGFLMEKNYVRKFRTYYPKVSDTSF